MAGIYNGYILEFPQIRVDCFTSPPRKAKDEITYFDIPHPYDPTLSPPASRPTSYSAASAQLFLLTHVHSDHLLGLSNEFTGKIICSPDTKRMLLLLEAEKARGFLANGTKEIIGRKYAGLKAKRYDVGKRSERVVDMLEAVPIGDPREYILGTQADGKPIRVTITLLDANHCPGSTMFLITSPQKAVLHTGDIRCDKLFIETLKRNPIIQEFLVPISTYTDPNVKYAEGGSSLQDLKGKVKIGGVPGSGRRVLDRIYLDTSAFLGTGDMPEKEDALRDLLGHMGQYPPDTIFFLNVWCFGWEDVVKEVARYFDSPVHIDRYKQSIYSAIKSDPFLSACTTTDPHSTRFHACERFDKCEVCRTYERGGDRIWNMDKRIVHVNMAEVKTATWTLERDDFTKKLQLAGDQESRGEPGVWPLNIICPIARHSPLPELQSLVGLFRPHAISPNTLVPLYAGLDYYHLPEIFSHLLQPGAYDRMIIERDAYFATRFTRTRIKELRATKAIAEGLKAALAADTAGPSERDDFMPDLTSTMASGGEGRSVGASRSAQAADQLQRLAGIAMSTPGVKGTKDGDNGEGKWDDEEDGDGDDTDEEDRRRKRQRMTKRDSAPISNKVKNEDGDMALWDSAVKVERDVSSPVRYKVEEKVKVVKVEKQGLLPNKTALFVDERKPVLPLALPPLATTSRRSAIQSPRLAPPPISLLPVPTRQIKREKNAIAGPSKPSPRISLPEIPPFRARPLPASRQQSTKSTSSAEAGTVTSPLPKAVRATPQIPTENLLARPSPIPFVKSERNSAPLQSTPVIKLEGGSTGTTVQKPPWSAKTGKIFTDRARMSALFRSKDGPA